MHIRLLLGVWLLGLCSAVQALDERAPPAVDLSGRWAVNAALSDDADAVLLERLEQQLRREKRWRKEQAREEGDELPPEPEPPQPGQTSRLLVQLRRALELYSMIEIKQSAAGDQIELRGDSNQRRFTPGRSAMSMPEGQLADAVVGWDGADFVIDRKVRKGPRIVERYQLLKKTGQLQVIVKWGGASDELLYGVKIKRVFDRTTGTQAPPDPEVGPVR